MLQFRTRLLEILDALSKGAKFQIEYLKKIGGTSDLYLPVDELALEFDDVFRLVGQNSAEARISQQTMSCLAALDEHLDKMSGAQNERLWTYDALQNSPEWNKVREHARVCLELLNEPSIQ